MYRCCQDVRVRTSSRAASTEGCNGVSASSRNSCWLVVVPLVGRHIWNRILLLFRKYPENANTRPSLWIVCGKRNDAPATSTPERDDSISLPIRSIVPVTTNDSKMINSRHARIATRALTACSIQDVYGDPLEDKPSACPHINNEVPLHTFTEAIVIYEDMWTTVNKWKLRWFGHVGRSSGLCEYIWHGAVSGKMKIGRQKKRWADDIKEWTGRYINSCQRAADDRLIWQKIVADVSSVAATTLVFPEHR